MLTLFSFVPQELEALSAKLNADADNFEELARIYRAQMKISYVTTSRGISDQSKNDHFRKVDLVKGQKLTFVLRPKSTIWMKSVVGRKIGKYAINLVHDIKKFEATGSTTTKTWATKGDRNQSCQSKNTMGYQQREPDYLSQVSMARSLTVAVNESSGRGSSYIIFNRSIL